MGTFAGKHWPVCRVCCMWTRAGAQGQSLNDSWSAQSSRHLSLHPWISHCPAKAAWQQCLSSSRTSWWRFSLSTRELFTPRSPESWKWLFLRWWWKTFYCILYVTSEDNILAPDVAITRQDKLPALFLGSIPIMKQVCWLFLTASERPELNCTPHRV